MDNRNDRTGRTDGVCVGMRVRGGCLPWMETREYSYLLVLHDSLLCASHWLGMLSYNQPRELAL